MGKAAGDHDPETGLDVSARGVVGPRKALHGSIETAVRFPPEILEGIASEAAHEGSPPATWVEIFVAVGSRGVVRSREGIPAECQTGRQLKNIDSLHSQAPKNCAAKIGLENLEPRQPLGRVHWNAESETKENRLKRSHINSENRFP